MSEISCCICDRTVRQVRDKLKSIDIENQKEEFKKEPGKIRESEKEKSDYASWLSVLMELSSKDSELLVQTVRSEKEYFGELSIIVNDIITYLSKRRYKPHKPRKPLEKLRVGDLLVLLNDYKPLILKELDYDRYKEITPNQLIDTLPDNEVMLEIPIVVIRRQGKRNHGLKLKGHVCMICDTVAKRHVYPRDG